MRNTWKHVPRNPDLNPVGLTTPESMPILIAVLPPGQQPAAQEVPVGRELLQQLLGTASQVG